MSVPVFVYSQEPEAVSNDGLNAGTRYLGLTVGRGQGSISRTFAFSGRYQYFVKDKWSVSGDLLRDSNIITRESYTGIGVSTRYYLPFGSRWSVYSELGA